MITITIAHSYLEDYFMISDIEVETSDKQEKERILERFKKIDGDFVTPGAGLRKWVADMLGVDVKLIELDTVEMDIM